MILIAVIGLGPARGPLLAKARSDPDAFADFYEAYADGVFKFAARRVLNAEVALDITSETFAVALERRLQFRGKTRKEEQGWLFGIANGQLLHYWRRGKVEQNALQRLAAELPTLRGLSEVDLERLEARAGVQTVVKDLGAALGDLPQDQSDAIRMRIVEEISYADIAAAQGVKQELVRARVSRGLRTLAVQLNSRGIYGEDVA